MADPAADISVVLGDRAGTYLSTWSSEADLHRIVATLVRQYPDKIVSASRDGDRLADELEDEVALAVCRARSPAALASEWSRTDFASAKAAALEVSSGGRLTEDPEGARWWRRAALLDLRRALYWRRIELEAGR